MNRRAAIQYLHDRHPHVIDAPGEEVALEALGLEFVWFQGHVCDLMDERAEAGPRRCFATIHHLLVSGNRDVRNAVWGDFLQPHLVCQTDLEWAKKQMSPLLADLCGRLEQLHDEHFGHGPPANADT